MLEGRTGEQAARHVGPRPVAVSQLLRASRSTDRRRDDHRIHPPYGFGNDTTGDPNAPKKKQPGDPDYGLGLERAGGGR